MDKGKFMNVVRYPPSPRIDHVEILHGVEVQDPYRWLEDIDSKQTQDWIKAQNEVTFEYLARTPARRKIRKRLTRLWNYEKYGIPFKKAGRYFFLLNDGLQNQSVLYWMEHIDAESRVLLDPNKLSPDGTVALTGTSVSEDGKLLAYGLSSSGSDWQEWGIRDVETGQDLDDRIKWTKFTNNPWTHDHKGFFYSRYDEPDEGMAYKGANYYQKLFYHRLGTPQSEDVLIYERADHKEWRFGAEVTQDGRYLVIWVSRGTYPENGIFYRDWQAKDGEIVELLNRFDAKYEFIGNDSDVFYFLTELDAPLSRVVAVDVGKPDPSDWKEIIPESGESLRSVSIVKNKFVASYLRDAHSVVRVFNKKGEPIREVRIPGLGTVTGFSGRPEDSETFYLFTGFTEPGTIYRYDVDTGESTLFRQPKVGFEPKDFVTEQVFYKSKDGTSVPMFITYKKGLKLDGTNPTLLYGYGGFNNSLTPAFNARSIVWMEMRGLFAQANLRGGGEYGRPWHEAGIKLKKQNVFDDFIAAAEWLIQNKYTNNRKLAVVGRSNGGLLVGACLTQRPDLYGACLPGVGVLDMLRFHKFTVGWGWVSDYGSPEDAEEFSALLSYSPYHNVKPGKIYPPTLITTADHDDRVFPAHSFKFAAALQSAQAGDSPILIRVDSKAGHGGGKPTSKVVDEYTDELSFLVQNLRVDAE